MTRWMKDPKAQAMRRASAVLCAIGLAGTAQAFDCAAGLPYHSIGPGVLGGYDYVALDDGWIMVDTPTANAGGDWIVLEHCPTRMHMTISGEPIPDSARDDLGRMLNSEESFTLRQMSDVIIETGLGIGIGQGQFDSCPCAREADPATREGAGW